MGKIDLLNASAADIVKIIRAEDESEVKRKAMVKALRAKLKTKLDAKKV